ncbi:hypothetical protein M9H77_29861 [Catharanthus roseus]|uniref:Uncharacterized protein n=1 Tax=Catharanthus roseus TaxID=4058 RepID=A0ACB9ZVY5_CATRO|nr:hypothetical protein M9H77_29861 [Catharanthus roseus]
MAIPFPSCSASSYAANHLGVVLSPPLPPPHSVSSISGHRILPRFTGLKLQYPSRNRQLSKSFRRPDGVVCEASETSLDVPTVTDETWKSLVLEADFPVLVEFWAPWCGPCRMLHPVVGDLSRQYVGRLKCFNLNTDDSPLTASKYGIRSIPTIMIFVNGVKKDAIIGAVPKTTLSASIDKFL